MMINYNSDVNTSYGLTGFAVVFVILLSLLVILASVITIISLAKIFKRLNKPSWAAIVPVYKELVLLELANLKWWYIFLLLIPLINVYYMYIICNAIAKKFNKPTGFSLGMILIPYVFLPLLAFKCELKKEDELDNLMIDESTNEDNVEELSI